MKPFLHWRCFKAITQATATHDSHYFTCLCHLGQRDINRNDPICVVQPSQVMKAKAGHDRAGIIMYKHRQCTRAFTDDLNPKTQKHYNYLQSIFNQKLFTKDIKNVMQNSRELY
jgi:hypothetical protein